MDIVDELVDLARLAFEANPREAEPLVLRIADATESYRLGRVLRMELSRLRCTPAPSTGRAVSLLDEMEALAEAHEAKVVELEADLELAKGGNEEVLEEHADLLELMGEPRPKTTEEESE